MGKSGKAHISWSALRTCHTSWSRTSTATSATSASTNYAKKDHPPPLPPSRSLNCSIHSRSFMLVRMVGRSLPMSAYFNEIDPKAAAWLRELIKQGHIADGVVDNRDIRDI